MDRAENISELISLTEASQISGLSAAHLRRLVDQKRLWGKKIGRNWVTSRSAVEEYFIQPHPRGRKPKKP